jgi:hypothetical protein
MDAADALCKPEKSIALHDVFGIGIHQDPGENTLKLGQSPLERCFNMMFRPQAHETGIRIHVGMKDGCSEIDLRGHSRIVTRKDDAQAVVAADRFFRGSAIAGRTDQRRQAIHLEREVVAIARKLQPIGIGLPQRLEQVPFILDSASAHDQEGLFATNDNR